MHYLKFLSKGIRKLNLQLNLLEIMNEPFVPRELHGKRLMGYSLGGFGFVLTNILGGVFTFQFYVYTINLNSLLVSSGFVMTLIIAAITFIYFGVKIDNKKPGKFGKRRPFLFYGLPIWVLASILIWLPPWYCPKNDSMFLPTAIYFWVISILKAVSGTSVMVAHASMFPEQSQTRRNQEKASALGAFLMIIASIIALLMPMIIQSMLEDPENVKWWEPSGKVILLYIPIIGTVFAIFGLVGIILAFFSVDETFHQATREEEIEKKNFKAALQQMVVPAKDKKYRKFLIVGLFLGISGRIVGLIVIPFLIYVLKFRGTDYFIYIIISFSSKFGWFFIWKKILKRQPLIKTYSMCIAISVIASFLELFFLIEVLTFELKIALFIISYGTLLGSMYAFNLFGGPIFSALVYEAAEKSETDNMDEAVSELSGAYIGLGIFVGSIGPAIASMLAGFVLLGSNKENPIILTIFISSTWIFYLFALIFLMQIKLDKSLLDIQPVSTDKIKVSKIKIIEDI